MTPGARVAAAIAVLDQIIAGTPAEQALTGWARQSRFAGSKDRAAVRDHVFDVLRAKRSLGDGDGRGLMINLARREDWDIAALFSGEGHTPAPLTDAEHSAPFPLQDLSKAAQCDLPDWLWPKWQDSLGSDAVVAAQAQQNRADVFLRVNARRTTVADVTTKLAVDGIAVAPHATVASCLRVLENARRVKNTTAYLDGLVELQDASSQRAVQAVPLSKGARVLDYCAGGGGKALAFADRDDVQIFAHDIDTRRMKDLPVRAQRAGVDVTLLASSALAQSAPFDVVFCDAPCSGSGTWRRAPDAKWRFSQEKLDALMQSQDEVLRVASTLVSASGLLVYATCSVLSDENAGALQRFLGKCSGWTIVHQDQRTPSTEGDGFYFAHLGREIQPRRA